MSTRVVRRALSVGLPLALLSTLGVAATATAGTQEGHGHHERPDRTARITGSAVLGDIPLAGFSNGLLPGTVSDDRGVQLGGIGSDIYPAGRKGEFWTVTDRGPNGQIKVDGKKRRTFPVAGFDPAIVKIRVSGKKIKVLSAIPITTRSGAPVTGLPNQASRDEAPYTHDALTPSRTTRTGWTPRASSVRRTARSGWWTSTAPPWSMSPRAAGCWPATCPRACG